MTVAELTEVLGSRARALATVRWLWSRPQWSPLPAALPDVQAKAWERLRAACELPEFSIVEQSRSTDGTTKLAVQFGQASVETVLIPAAGRSTVCVSSQAGCTRNCSFCATATLGFNRNLGAGEIVAQYWHARRMASPAAPARNVVFMGMGEPMDNLDAVLRAIEVLTQSPAPQLAASHITVSTSGVLPGMVRFLKESRASLALSVNASHDAQRAELMPQTKRWPLKALMDELRRDRLENPRRIHFLEYVMFDGVNDTAEDATRLLALLDGVAARINLIAHNSFAGNPLRPSSDDAISAFQRRVIAGGFACFVRGSRGRDVDAACGQLALRAAPRKAFL